MKLLDLIRSRLVIPSLRATEKRAAIEELVDFIVREGELAPAVRAAVLKAVHGREDFMSTGMEHGIALPHGVTDVIQEELAAIGVSKGGIPFESFDGEPARIVILLLTPTPKALTRVRTLAEIARIMNDPALRAALVQAESAPKAVDAIRAAAARCAQNQSRPT